MTMVKTLVALATERMLLKTSGATFLKGIEFMYAAGLAPDRLSVMMTTSHKYVLQFHSKCDIRPFAANYPNFARVLRGIVHVRAWRIKSIEFVNVAFHMRDVENLERAIEKLGVELVLLRNCTYPGVNRGEEAVKFLSALNRKKQAVVCEYGDDRLKHRISRRNVSSRRPSRMNQDMARLNADNNERNDAGPNGAALPPVAVPYPAPNPLPANIPLPQPPQGLPGLHRNLPEQMDQQVVALALQLINDQQAQLHGMYHRMQRQQQPQQVPQRGPVRPGIMDNRQVDRLDQVPPAQLYNPPYIDIRVRQPEREMIREAMRVDPAEEAINVQNNAVPVVLNNMEEDETEEAENEVVDIEMAERRPEEAQHRAAPMQAFDDEEDGDIDRDNNDVARAGENPEIEENSPSPQAALLR